MRTWRYRRCPHYGNTFPGGRLKVIRRGYGHWRSYGGWGWRRCPACGRKGQTRDFPVVSDLRRLAAEGTAEVAT